MNSEYQPKFNRVSLNVLMVASAALIVIFGQSARQMDQKPLPPPPKIDISIWHADSGAKVWYSPYFSDTLEIQLWYQAGFAYDANHTGRASLLAKLLKFESKSHQLPMQVALDQDFLKVTLHLNTDPVQMKQQIEKSVALLYRPKLSTSAINKIQAMPSITSLSEQLWRQAYQQHPYGQAQDQTQTFTRAQLQKYQQQFVHPQRLYASIVGDISERGAQIIMESLLPNSKYKAAATSDFASKELHNIQKQQHFIAVWPGEFSNRPDGKDALENPKPMQTQQDKLHIDKQMTVQLLKSTHGDLIKWHPGHANSTLLVQQPEQMKHTIENQIDADTIAQQTHQLAKKWLSQVNHAQGLSQYLVQLNAYHLPVNQLNKNLIALGNWDEDDWHHASKTLLPWLHKD